MSGRTTRQRSKPVILDLRKTDVGYEIIDFKYTDPIPVPKSVITRPERPLNYSKSLIPKSMDKGSVSPSGSAHLSDSMSRSKTMVRPPMPSSSKINIQNGMPMPERNLSGRMGDMGIKEEFSTFNSLNMSTGRLGPMAKMPLGGELNISSQFEKPLGGPSFGRSMHAPEGGYPRQVERPLKTYPVIIPSVAQWFEMDKIHQIEKDYMPEFFLGKPTKTPEVYKRYRNYMISMYRQNPSMYLNSTMCRKHLAGDACSIMRIHSFLEHWGLINFHIDPAGYPKNLFLNKSNRCSEKLFEFSNNDLKMDIIEQAITNNLPDTEKDTLIRQIKTMTKNAGPFCDFCAMGCGPVWYLQKSPSQPQPVNPEPEAGQALQPGQQENGLKKFSAERRLVICIECFNKGNIPSVLTANDFEKADLVQHLESETARSQALGSWTLEDTYKLLDLIQKNGDNWTEILKSFPHKTKEDLVACYLLMPIEKITSLSIVEMGETRGHEDNPDDRITDQAPTVFGDFSNPILQHVAVFKSLLTKNREQKKLKKKAMEKAAEEVKEAKVEERSDLEITKVSDKAKEEEPSVTGQQAEPVKVEGEEEKEEKEFEMGEGEETKGKEDEMEEEKEDTAVKTEQDNVKDFANRLVEMQILKLHSKVEYLEDYEKILAHERKQYEVLQQGLATERIEVAHKRQEALKQMAPPQQQQQQHPAAYPEQAVPDASYFDFGGSGANFGSYDMLDLGEGFPKDSF